MKVTIDDFYKAMIDIRRTIEDPDSDEKKLDAIHSISDDMIFKYNHDA